MCRNIKTLFNYEPPASKDEIRAASVQLVRKVSGSAKPSRLNQAAFDQAVDDISVVIADLLNSLVTSAPTRDRQIEAARARARAQKRFGGVA